MGAPAFFFAGGVEDSGRRARVSRLDPMNCCRWTGPAWKGRGPPEETFLQADFAVIPGAAGSPAACGAEVW
ncbi:hypothetical protein WA016_00557 [Myxococcus stipitatus]